MLLTARQNFHRLSWQASYTYAKTLTYGGTINDIYDASHYYGPASGSVPKSANGTVAYELPGRGLHNFTERALLAGWEVSGVFTAQAGTPFSLETTAAFVPITSALTGPASAGLNTVSSFGLGVSQGANQARIFQVTGKFQFWLDLRCCSNLI